MLKPAAVVPVAALVLCLLSGRLQAQAANEYDRSIKAAIAEFDAGNFGEARALFQRAHSLQPSARTLRGLGIAAVELHLYVEAVAELEAALAHPTRPLDKAQREQAQELLRRARLYVARIALTTEPADAVVQVDGRALERRDGELWLNPGEYVLSVSAEGFMAQRQPLRAISGVQSLAVVLEPVAGGTESPSPMAPSVEAESGGLPVLFWVAAAGAVAFGGTALALHLSAKGEQSEIEQDCPIDPARACSRMEIDRRIDDAGLPTLNVLTVVALGVAVASAASAGLVLLLDNGDANGGAAQPVSVEVGSRAVALALRF